MKASTFHLTYRARLEPAHPLSDPVYNHVLKLDLKSLLWNPLQNQRFEEFKHLLAAFDAGDMGLLFKVGHGNLEVFHLCVGQLGISPTITNHSKAPVRFLKRPVGAPRSTCGWRGASLSQGLKRLLHGLTPLGNPRDEMLREQRFPTTPSTGSTIASPATRWSTPTSSNISPKRHPSPFDKLGLHAKSTVPAAG